MIRMLKRIADWLDARFPAKVHVTDEVFQSLLRRETERQLHLNTLGAAIEQEVKAARQGHRILQERIDDLEATIGGIKEVVTKAANPDAQAAARRAAFIESGRMPE